MVGCSFLPFSLANLVAVFAQQIVHYVFITSFFTLICVLFTIKISLFIYQSYVNLIGGYGIFCLPDLTSTSLLKKERVTEYCRAVQVLSVLLTLEKGDLFSFSFQSLVTYYSKPNALSPFSLRAI